MYQGRFVGNGEDRPFTLAKYDDIYEVANPDGEGIAFGSTNQYSFTSAGESNDFIPGIQCLNEYENRWWYWHVALGSPEAHWKLRSWDIQCVLEEDALASDFDFSADCDPFLRYTSPSK